MRKLFVGVAGLVVLLVAAALIVPSFINWNEYKGEITAEIEKQTGRTVVIGGDIGLTLLPAPAVVAKDLRLGNMDGAKADDMIRLGSLEVRVAFGPLLQGRVQVQKIRLVNPVVHLETLADGRNNWDFSKPRESGESKSGPSSAAPAPMVSSAGETDEGAGPPVTIQFDSLEVENGVVVYRDDTAGLVERVEDLNATVAAGSLTGPFEAEGSLTARGTRTGFRISLGQIDQQSPLPVSLVLTPGAGNARFELRGMASELAASPRFIGSLEAKADNLAALIQATTGGGGLPGGLSQPLDLAGEVNASAARVNVSGLSMHLGKTGATGEISARLDDQPAVSAQLAIAHLDLDSWLRASAMGGEEQEPRSDAVPPPPSQTSVPSEAPRPSRDGPPSDLGMRLPTDLTASLAVSAEAITYRGGIIRDARVNAQLTEGEITVSQISGDLPGATKMTAFGVVTIPDGAPRFDGEMDIRAGELRALLGWVGVDAGAINPGRVRAAEAKSKISVTPGVLRLREMDLRFDASRVTGGVSIALATQPVFDVDLAIDQIDVDAYLPIPGADPTDEADPPATKAEAATSDRPTKVESGGAEKSGLETLRAMDATVKARVGRLTYKGTPFEKVVVDAALLDGVVDVSEASVANVAGASGQLSGVIEPLAQQPGAKRLSFQFQIPNLDRLLRALDLPRPNPVASVAPFAVSGTADGPFVRPTVNIVLHAAGGETKLSGVLDVLPNPGFIGQVKLARVNIVPLLSSLGVNYQPSGRIGTLDLSGHLDAHPSRVNLTGIGGAIGDTSVQGSINANLTGTRPAVTADLKIGRLVIDPYLPAKKTAQVTPRLIPASWNLSPEPRHAGAPYIYSAAEAPHRRWSRELLDFSALQAMDADLKLKSDGITYDRYVLDNVEAVATLAAGVLTAEPIAGSLFRGPFQANLRVDANGTPRVDGALTVKNADLARVTRDARGRAVATGQMTFAAKVASGGNSTAELISALDGSGSLRMSNMEVGKGAAGGETASVINLLQQMNGIAAGFGVSGSRAEVTGSFRIRDGVVRTDDIALKSGLGDGSAQGVVDLPRWQMDVGGEIHLRGNILTGLMIETKGPPIVPFRIRGAVDDPNVKVDANALKVRRLVIPNPKDLDVKKGLKELRKLFK